MSPVYSFRISMKLLKRLRRQAKKENIPVSQLILRAIEQYLN